MQYIKWFAQLNLFQPQKAKSLAELELNVGDKIVVLQDDGSPYAMCGAVYPPVQNTLVQRKNKLLGKPLLA